MPLPALDWLKRYELKWLCGDVVAGMNRFTSVADAVEAFQKQTTT